MKDLSKIKPYRSVKSDYRCVFCGHRLMVSKDHEEGGWSAFCDKCGACYGHYDTYQDLDYTITFPSFAATRPYPVHVCPVCSGAPEVHDHDKDGTPSLVLCRRCAMDVSGKTLKKAIRKWNRRAYE